MRQRSRNGHYSGKQEEIAQAVGLSDRTVRQYLNMLREEGYLSWERRRRESNVYSLDRETTSVQASDLHFNGNGLAGRKEELKQLLDQGSKGTHVLLYGNEGSGKSTLLKELTNGNKWTGKQQIFIPFSSPAKPFLVNLARELGLDGNLSHMSIRELHRLCLEEVSKRDLVLILDNMDRLTPAQRYIVEELMNYCQIIAACSHRKDTDSSFWLNFKEIELKPLADEAVAAIIDRFFLDNDVLISPEDYEVLKRKLIRFARGNPKRLMAILNRIKEEGAIDRIFIQEELQVKDDNFIYVGALVIIIAAVVMAVRYLGLGLNDVGLYLLAGTGYAFFYILRYFTWSWRKERKR